MSYQLAKRREIKTIIKWNLQVDEDKKPEMAEIQVWFKIQPKKVKKQRDLTTAARLKELSNMLQGRYINDLDVQPAGEEASEVEALDNDKQLEYLLEDITRIDGVLDEEGEEAEFCTDLLDQVLDDSAARQAIELKWRDIQDDSVWKREKRKN